MKLGRYEIGMWSLYTNGIGSQETTDWDIYIRSKGQNGGRDVKMGSFLGEENGVIIEYRNEIYTDDRNSVIMED